MSNNPKQKKGKKKTITEKKKYSRKFYIFAHVHTVFITKYLLLYLQ